MDTIYVHFPDLVIEQESINVLGGTLKKFDFDTFQKLDRDWARKNYFTKSNPTIWSYQTDFGPMVNGSYSDFIGKNINPKIVLLYYAILTVTRQNYLNPLLSAKYLQKEGFVGRFFGVYDRTLLLNRPPLPAISNEQIDSITSLVNKWDEGGLSYEHEVFSPLRVLSSFAATSTNPGTAVLPLIVVLEGFLIEEKVRGIANEIYRRIYKLLQTDPFSDLKNFIKDIYTWRSDIIHGRPKSFDTYVEMLPKLKELISMIVCAAASWIINENNHDFSSFQSYLK